MHARRTLMARYLFNEDLKRVVDLEARANVPSEISRMREDFRTLLRWFLCIVGIYLWSWYAYHSI